MTKANEVLIDLNEGNKTKDLYDFMKKMDKASSYSFLFDLQSALDRYANKMIPTDVFKDIFKSDYIFIEEITKLKSPDIKGECK